MAGTDEAPLGADLTKGVAAADLIEGRMLVGHVGGASVLLARASGETYAVSALCTHYQAPLADGLLVGETIRCPWHHARFCLKTGEAIGAPAIDPLDCWSIEDREGRIYVRARTGAPRPKKREGGPGRIVVVGGGAGGFAAAEMLRREGYGGALTLLSADPDPPYDRPNLSKDYLAGKASRDWMPLRDPGFYQSSDIQLQTGVEVGQIDLGGRKVILRSGESVDYDALILATGASPIRPDIPGFDDARVHVLRSFQDCEAIIRAAESASRVVVVGASFIGLEVAAALTERGVAVQVVAPDTTPFARRLGVQLGRFIQGLHEEKGVIFHLGRSVAGFKEGKVTLDDGSILPADFVVAGVGVKPRTELAAGAGLAVDKGVIVDARLETKASGVFAVGDIARYPDRRTGASIRVEHWVAAERQGQHVARVLLGQAEAFTDLPFFWTAHYDEAIHYMGHAEDHEAVDIDGSIADHDATVRFTAKGRVLAVATLGRDLDSLKAELALETDGGVQA